MMEYIDGDEAYPIYRVDVRWIQDGEHDEKYPSWYKGLRAGRMRNNTGWHRMYRNEDNVGAIKADERKWWKGYREEKLAGKNPSRRKITIDGPEYETWCLNWFQHWTFDTGLSDREYLDSFGRYVRRYEYMQDYYPGDMPEGYRCLMGAEDRWRWHGLLEDNGAQTTAPCRCEHCKKLGIIRIGH